MIKGPKIRSAIIALVIILVLASSAYLIGGALHDRLVPGEDEFGAQVTIKMEQGSSGGAGWTDEQSNITTIVTDEGSYVVSISLKGLDEEKGVILKLTITGPGISVSHVDTAHWFEEATNTWRSLDLIDVGDTLEAVIGPSDGQDVFDGFDQSYLVIISFNINSTITFAGYGELSEQ